MQDKLLEEEFTKLGKAFKDLNLAPSELDQALDHIADLYRIIFRNRLLKIIANGASTPIAQDDKSNPKYSKKLRKDFFGATQLIKDTFRHKSRLDFAEIAKPLKKEFMGIKDATVLALVLDVLKGTSWKFKSFQEGFVNEFKTGVREKATPLYKKEFIKSEAPVRYSYDSQIEGNKKYQDFLLECSSIAMNNLTSVSCLIFFKQNRDNPFEPLKEFRVDRNFPGLLRKYLKHYIINKNPVMIQVRINKVGDDFVTKVLDILHDILA